MDPAKKESILGDLRMANAAINQGMTKEGLQLLEIALARMKESQ